MPSKARAKNRFEVEANLFLNTKILARMRPCNPANRFIAVKKPYVKSPSKEFGINFLDNLPH